MKTYEYEKKVAAQMLCVTVREVNRMLKDGDLKGIWGRNSQNRIVEFVDSDSLESVLDDLTKARGSIREITSICREYHPKLEEKIVIKWPSMGTDAEGHLTLYAFSFFDTANKADVRKLWKLHTTGINKIDAATRIRSYLQKASEAILCDLRTMEQAEKRLANKVYTQHPAKSSIGRECESKFKRLEQELKHLKKRQVLFEEWMMMFTQEDFQ